MVLVTCMGETVGIKPLVSHEQPGHSTRMRYINLLLLTYFTYLQPLQVVTLTTEPWPLLGTTSKTPNIIV